MGWAFAILSLLALAVVLAAVYRSLGDYMAWAYASEKDWRAERGFYRLIGVDPKAEQTWRSYLRALLIFSAAGLLFVYLLQRTQQWLPFSLGFPATSPFLSFNTAASFVTNTNWQSYSPEQTLGYSVQLGGLAVQNFVSAAAGMAVAIALVRGLAARKSETIGNFWVDLTRGTTRILLPIAVIGAIVLLAGGVIQNFHSFLDIHTIAGQSQSIPGGPVASQEAIKLLGTNGGGFFNTNSAHPFENPSGWTNGFEILLMLAIPFALPRTFGRMVGDHRQGYAILATMAGLFVVSYLILTALQFGGHGTAPQLAGGATEGIEQRIGIANSSLFSTTSTGTSTGAVDAMHDSYTALGGMMTMLNMMLGEVAPGGVGSGLYGILIDAIIAVFVAGLLVGRTPEYLGKKIGPREMKLASLYILVTPALVLAGTAMSFGVPGVKHSVTNTSIWNPGVHGMSEVLYAFTSAANNNGSAFAGLTANTPWLNTALGVTMLLGRFIPIIFALALAGSLAQQTKVPATAGTLPTHGGLFVGLLVGVIIIVTALTYFPVLTLGPLAEGL
jgi:potassium-transporting ATPase potassium-binding subunit